MLSVRGPVAEGAICGEKDPVPSDPATGVNGVFDGEVGLAENESDVLLRAFVGWKLDAIHSAACVEDERAGLSIVGVSGVLKVARRFGAKRHSEPRQPMAIF